MIRVFVPWVGCAAALTICQAEVNRDWLIIFISYFLFARFKSGSAEPCTQFLICLQCRESESWFHPTKVISELYFWGSGIKNWPDAGWFLENFISICQPGFQGNYADANTYSPKIGISGIRTPG